MEDGQHILADTSDRGVVPERRDQARAQIPQDLVAAGFAEPVIDVLEPVQADTEDGQGLFRLVSRRRMAGEGFCEPFGIQQLGDRVAKGPVSGTGLSRATGVPVLPPLADQNKTGGNQTRADRRHRRCEGRTVRRVRYQKPDDEHQADQGDGCQRAHRVLRQRAHRGASARGQGAGQRGTFHEPWPLAATLTLRYEAHR